MLSGIHFLLTYSCNFTCDHCFLYCSPEAEGTFTLQQLKAVFDEMMKIKSLSTVYFEGGEPFLYYPLMLEGIRLSQEKGYKTGVVTNAYWATSVEDAELWLKPLQQLAVADISVSNDAFHHGEDKENPATRALVAMKNLDIPGGDICIEEPTIETSSANEQEKGSPVIGGGVMLRGRATDTLIGNLPRIHWKTFKVCPYEELEQPSRVHLDSFGNVHICQGISIGNMWQTPLSEIISIYNAFEHPITGPLVKGGPAFLADKLQVKHENSYVDACHFCYSIRKTVIEDFPEIITPPQIYGIKQ